MHLCHTESKLLFHEIPLLSIIMQVRLVCLSYVLLFCTCIDTYIYMHMYKWKALLALTIVDVAFFILHDYYNYESLVFFGLLLLPFINFMQTHTFGGGGWCGNLNFLNTFIFFFCRGKEKNICGLCLWGGKKKTFPFFMGQKRKNTHWISLSLFISLHTLSRKSLSFTIATPCTMHLGGVSCFVTSSIINLAFHQSLGRKIPCNGFLNSQ